MKRSIFQCPAFLKPAFLKHVALSLFLSLALLTPRFAAADTRIASVFSSGAEGMRSYLRFYNAGATAGQVSVVVIDFSTGQSLGQWISPLIPGGAERQYDIGDIEPSMPASQRPYYYTVIVQAPFDGYVQHVLWRSADGTLTNLSSCNTGVTATGGTLVGVHSTLLNYAYPSTVIVNNTGALAAAATLGVYDARDGTKLGTYTTTSIAAGGAQNLSLNQIESAMGLHPDSSMYHYVIKTEGQFTGFLQNLVDNLGTGVTTDMTNECALNNAPVAGRVLPLQIGAVYSTAQLKSQSYLRFFNTGGTAGYLHVQVRDQASGQSYGTWTSPPINAGAERQFNIGDIENDIQKEFGQFAKPPFYTMSINTDMSGYFQHVLWRVTDGTLTNLSTCNGGVTADLSKLSGIHSTLLARQYPSSVSINNLGAATTVRVGIYDARDARPLGSFTTDTIPANGTIMLSSALLEGLAGIHPTDTQMYHYVVKVESAFNGYVEHLVNNLQAKVVTDMTIACAMNAP